MKPQPRPALTVKRSEHVAAPGPEGPFCSSLWLYHISSGLPAPAWAQKPRPRVTPDNVPVSSRQQAPPGPATPSAPQAPGECLRASVSGKELLKARNVQKRWQGSQCLFTVPPGGGYGTWGGGTSKRVSATESEVRAARLPPRTRPSVFPPPARRTGLRIARGAGGGGGVLGAAGPGRVGPSLAPGGRSICPHVHLRRPGRTAGGARRSRPRPSDPSPRGGRRGRGAAARPQAEPDPRRAPRRLRGGSGRPDAPATVAVNTSSCPGELFQQAGKDRYFEWQATPFLTPRIDVAPAALMGA